MPTLPNLKLYAALAALLVAFGAGCFITKMAMHIANEKALKQQEALLIGQCNDDKLSLEKANDNIQKEQGITNSKLAQYKRLLANECVPISGITKPPGTGARPVGANELFDLAAECRNYWVYLKEVEKIKIIPR